MTDLHKIAAPDAEAAFLGAMLADPDQIDAMVAEGLVEHDFAVHLHRRAWTALVALRASDTPVDEVTLWQEMESTGATRPEWLHDLASWSSLAGAMPTLSRARPRARLRDARR
jgi:replicative DNA helicase